MSTTPLPDRASRRAVAPSLPCVHCAYDLAGVPDDANCPECGHPGASTMLHSLYRQPLESLSRIRSGIWWITAGIIAAILLPLPGSVLIATANDLAQEGDGVGAAAVSGASGLLVVGVTVVAMIGFRRFATPLSQTDDRRLDRPGVRRAMGVSALLSVPLAIMAAATDIALTAGTTEMVKGETGESSLYTAGFYAMLVVSVLNAMNSAVLHLSTAAHAATLAARGARLKLERRARFIVRAGLITYAFVILTSAFAFVQVLFPDAAGPPGVAILGALGIVVGVAFLILAIAWLLMLSKTLSMVAAARKRLRFESAPA